MKAIIMAGGEGTRLRPLTGTIPKPLAKLCGRPAVEYILDLLIKHGFSEAVFTLRYKGEMIERLFESEYYMAQAFDKGINLRFSYEDEPLGTAGCVKKAAADFTDDFLVISGDALCDFNLSAALKFHKETQAEATVITKQVSDPREYGLVISDGANSAITGFSEKPSYLNCISDYANTGVYILNPSALELIPNGKMWDFARDVFPKMLKEKRPLMAFAESGYWCDIGDIDTYVSCQRDILSGKVDCSINAERITDSIYSGSALPSNVVVKAPAYIGRNVQLGKNCVISGSVLSDNVTLGANCRVSDSVILDGVITAGGLISEGAVICENVKIKSDVRLSDGAVIGEGSVINENASVESGVRVWQNKSIPANTVVCNDFKYGGKGKIEISERGITGDTNIDITPDFAAKTGCALSALHPNNVLVACEENNASVSLKNALISGVSSTGVNSSNCGFATLPMLIHLSKLMLSDLIVHIRANAKTEIIILNGHGLALTRQQERSLEAGLNRAEYRSAPCDSFGAVSDIKCADELYISMLNHMSDFKSGCNIILNCGNERLLALLKPVFGRISSTNGEQLIITLNNAGTKAEFRLGKDFVIHHDNLILLACLDMFISGCDVALPADFPSAADVLAERYGRRVQRFFACSNDDSDKKARATAESEAFLWDGAYLALFVLGWIARDGASLIEAARSLPEFNRESRVILIDCPPQRILGKLCKGKMGCGEGIIISGEGEARGGRVLLRSNKKGNALFLMAESVSAETAKSLCDDVETEVKRLMLDI
ncbi:MAG: NTP transferase domain-containing protein [Oscillospiraceae bacterium]|jgi:mannose-1-phosphate guanylyltransferase/phosphomannomutase|nr:NTP transferase domain-containing protein [Oscillospiraceae bacterium]